MNDEITATPEQSTNIVEDDALRASESPALEDVRELLNPTIDEHDIPKSESPRAPDDNADNAGRSISLEAEDASPHERNATIAQDAAPNSSDVAYLSEISYEDPQIESTNERVVDDDNASPPSNEEEESDSLNLTGSEHRVLSPALTASPNAPQGLGSEESDTDSRLKDGPESQRSETVASSHKSIANTPPKKEHDAQTSLSQRTPRSLPRKARTPANVKTPKQVNVSKQTCANTPGGSPQIGTSLLRRESLRRKESPSKKSNLRKSRSPKKRDTLQRRDTLQEREILQKVIAETAPDQNMEDLDRGIIESTLATNSDFAANAEPAGFNTPGRAGLMNDESAKEATMNGVEAAPPALHDAENKDLHRALEAIEAYKSPATIGNGAVSLAEFSDSVETKEAIDEANQTIAKMELNHAAQAIEAAEEQTDSSKMKTRSAARFSDDTSMLKEFLNRAQAKKAAQAPTLLVPDLPKPQTSPRRSPRKALGYHDDNALSPQRLRDVANRPGTPPGKPKLDSPESDDADESSAEPTSCRRSTRARLPAPPKAPPGAPSFIPVRRADGTDPVVLQKSQAQELAIVTRANTRRNKGQSKPPLLALQDLPVETTEVATMAKARGGHAKTVGWAERLASYQDAKEAEEAEETRPRVRRIRGLGSANGTPAPKRATAVVGTSNGTPAPKRRGKVL